MKKGENPIDLFGVVRRLQRTKGSSSTHAPYACLSRFLIPLHTRPLIFSTCPLVCDCATDAKLSLMPSLSQKSWNTLEAKFLPLSVRMLWGTPKRQVMPLKKLTVVVAVWLVTGMASIHLVNFSTATNRN